MTEDSITALRVGAFTWKIKDKLRVECGRETRGALWRTWTRVLSPGSFTTLRAQVVIPRPIIRPVAQVSEREVVGMIEKGSRLPAALK